MFAARAALMTPSKGGLKGSITCSGSSYIEVASSSAFNLGTGAFKIECWYYATSFSSNTAYLFDMGSNGTRIQLFQNNAYFIPQSGNYVTGASGVGFTTNTWNHIIMARSGGTLYGYINGALAGSTTNSSNLTDSACRINNFGEGTIGLTGFISNFRIVKDFDGSVTPPTSALTSISNTVILTAQDSGVIKDNGPNAFSLTNSGTSASSFSPF